MVEWLNGLLKWLFKRSTICLFGDKFAVLHADPVLHRWPVI